jgi:hypothetical protein
MTRSTSDSCDGNLRISLSNRNAVITGTNKRLRDIDARASLHVDTVSVGAVCWCRNLDFSTFEVLAFDKSYMKELAIQ